MDISKYTRVAVRAHTVLGQRKSQNKGLRRGEWKAPHLTIVLDCLASDDEAQGLIFGAWQVYRASALIDEGLFHDEELDEPAVDSLKRQARRLGSHKDIGRGELRVLDRGTFMQKVFYPVAFKARGLVVGFDLPFPISRIALDWTEARTGMFAGGFSFVMTEFVDEQGRRRADAFSPRIAIKAIDSSRALIGFTSVWRGNDVKAPRGSFRGHFLDTRTLANALGGESRTLEDSCADFGVEHVIRPEQDAIGSNGPSVRALMHRVETIWRLSRAELAEFSKFSISVPPTRVFSPASIGKAHLREMGIIVPDIEVDQSIERSADEIQGLLMASYFGGRSECRIRKLEVPVVYTDFLSMYPTIFSLMGLSKLLIAENLVAEDATEDVQEFLDNVCLDDLFEPEVWRDLCVIVLISPENDIFPERSRHGSSKQSPLTVGVNQVDSAFVLSYTLADCIAAKLLTGKCPKIQRAFRLRPVGAQANLQPIRLRGSAPINPYDDDFFVRLVEERHRLTLDSSLGAFERSRLSNFYKLVANSSSYGIFIEQNRRSGQAAEIAVYGMEAFECEVENPEETGEFYFPALATFTSAGARLMLAMLEAEISRCGGTYAFMDTDSMAIVASRDGDPADRNRATDGSQFEDGFYRVLSWEEVEEIREKFSSLNPYSKTLLPGSILKLEDENFEDKPVGKPRVDLRCYAIAAKKYVLFLREGNDIQLVKGTKHGLGNHVPPVDPSTGQPDEQWTEEAWRWILAKRTQ